MEENIPVMGSLDKNIHDLRYKNYNNQNLQ